jgi:hypothetical protein
VVLFLSTIAWAFHVIAFVVPYIIQSDLSADEKKKEMQDFLYIKNQFFAFVLLFTFVQYLEFLTVHHLFGPWAIIIRDIMNDLARFMVILFLFIAGFTLHVTSIFQPAYKPGDDVRESVHCVCYHIIYRRTKRCYEWHIPQQHWKCYSSHCSVLLSQIPCHRCIWCRRSVRFS